MAKITLRPKYEYSGICVYEGNQLHRSRSDWYFAYRESGLITPATWDMLVKLKWEYDECFGCVYAWQLYTKSLYNYLVVFSLDYKVLSYEEYNAKYGRVRESWDIKRIKENQRLSKLFDYKYD